MNYHKLFLENFDRIYAIHVLGVVDRKNNIDALKKNLNPGHLQVIAGVTPFTDDFMRGVDANNIKVFPSCFRCSSILCGKSDCNNVLLSSQMACYQSHQKALKEFVADGFRNCLIVEDDVKFNNYSSFALSNCDSSIIIRHYLDSNKPRLVKLAWAKDERHMPLDFVELESDEITMSNPAYALNRAAAILILKKLNEGIKHTADVIIHSENMEGLERKIMLPPIFDELSWTSGEIESLIHPKMKRVEFLKDKDENRNVLATLEDKVNTHIKHCEYDAALTVTVKSEEDIASLTKLFFDTLIQQVVFGLKPSFYSKYIIKGRYKEERLESMLQKSFKQLGEVVRKYFDGRNSIPPRNINSGFKKYLSNRGVSVFFDNSALLLTSPLTPHKQIERYLERRFGSKENISDKSIYFDNNVNLYRAYELYISCEKLNREERKKFKLSIIVVVRNPDERYLDTLKSIASQDLSECELIIIDGSDSDQSSLLAHNFLSSASVHKYLNYKILVGKDSGIYDAMNKAVTVSRGGYSYFINSADYFNDSYVLSNIKKRLNGKVDVIYGDTCITGSKGNSLIVSNDNTKYLLLGNIFSHQAVFIRSSILRENKFNDNYKIVADHNLFLYCFLSGKSFERIDRVIAMVDDSGVSSDPVKRTLERWCSTRNLLEKFDTSLLENIDKFFLSILSKEKIPAPIKYYADNKLNFLEKLKWM